MDGRKVSSFNLQQKMKKSKSSANHQKARVDQQQESCQQAAITKEHDSKPGKATTSYGVRRVSSDHQYQRREKLISLGNFQENRDEIRKQRIKQELEKHDLSEEELNLLLVDLVEPLKIDMLGIILQK